MEYEWKKMSKLDEYLILNHAWVHWVLGTGEQRLKIGMSGDMIIREGQGPPRAELLNLLK